MQATRRATRRRKGISQKPVLRNRIISLKKQNGNKKRRNLDAPVKTLGFAPIKVIRGVINPIAVMINNNGYDFALQTAEMLIQVLKKNKIPLPSGFNINSSIEELNSALLIAIDKELGDDQLKVHVKCDDASMLMLEVIHSYPYEERHNVIELSLLEKIEDPKLKALLEKCVAYLMQKTNVSTINDFSWYDASCFIEHLDAVVYDMREEGDEIGIKSVQKCLDFYNSEDLDKKLERLKRLPIKNLKRDLTSFVSTSDELNKIIFLMIGVINTGLGISYFDDRLEMNNDDDDDDDSDNDSPPPITNRDRNQIIWSAKDHIGCEIGDVIDSIFNEGGSLDPTDSHLLLHNKKINWNIKFVANLPLMLDTLFDHFNDFLIKQTENVK